MYSSIAFASVIVAANAIGLKDSQWSADMRAAKEAGEEMPADGWGVWGREEEAAAELPAEEGAEEAAEEPALDAAAEEEESTPGWMREREVLRDFGEHGQHGGDFWWGQYEAPAEIVGAEEDADEDEDPAGWANAQEGWAARDRAIRGTAAWNL